jgi:hypothetical protein
MEVLVMAPFRSREITIPAREIRPGDRLVPSGTEIVDVRRTRSGEILIRTATGNKIPMPERCPVVVSRQH